MVEVAARVRVIASAVSTSHSPHCAGNPAWHRVAVRDPTDSRGPADPRANLSLVLGAPPASGGWMCMPTGRVSKMRTVRVAGLRGGSGGQGDRRGVDGAGGVGPGDRHGLAGHT